MKRFLFVCFAWLLLSLVTATAARAGGYIQQWARGSVVLVSGDTIDGPVAYHHDEETLEVRLPDGTSRTFAAVNVSYFIVARERAQRLGANQSGFRPMIGFGGLGYGGYPGSMAWRNGVTDTSGVKLYVTYRWNQNNDYSDFRAPGFFQQLTDGTVRLLRRERIVERLATPAGPYGYGYGGMGMGGGYYTEIQASYFLADPDGKVTAIRNPKRDLPDYFGPARAKQIKAYAKQNKLSFSDPRQLVFIARYADELANPPAAASGATAR